MNRLISALVGVLIGLGLDAGITALATPPPCAGWHGTVAMAEGVR